MSLVFAIMISDNLVAHFEKRLAPTTERFWIRGMAAQIQQGPARQEEPLSEPPENAIRAT